MQKKKSVNSAEFNDIHSCGYHCDNPACIRAQRDSLAQRITDMECWKNAINKELISAFIWSEELANDPQKALHALEGWNQDVGAYFAAEELIALKRENKELRETISKFKAWWKWPLYLYQHLTKGRKDDSQMHMFL